MLINAEDLARDRWPDILTAAGVDRSYFRVSNGPCPFCGEGVDRYRWANKHGGVYVCSVCTEGKYRNGFDFLSRHKGFQAFADAANYVRAHFGINGSLDDQVVVKRLAQEPKRSITVDPQKSLARMTRQWEQACAVTPGDAVHRYLCNRVPGVTNIPSEVRYHPSLEYWNPPAEQGGPPVLLGRFAAMLVRGFDVHGNLVQLHKTYLDQEGHKAPVPHAKKTDQGVGSNSFALRMGTPTDTLGVCEGIETAIASSVMRNIPVWSCHSSSILANFELPTIFVGLVKRLIIFTDSDEIKNGRRAGEEAAKTLADRAKKMGLRSLIVRPAKVGTDFADLCRNSGPV